MVHDRPRCHGDLNRGRINRTHLAGNVDGAALGLLGEGDDTRDVGVTLKNSDSLCCASKVEFKASSWWMDWGFPACVTS